MFFEKRNSKTTQLFFSFFKNPLMHVANFENCCIHLDTDQTTHFHYLHPNVIEENEESMYLINKFIKQTKALLKEAADLLKTKK